jgi:hypothetical protein
MPCARINESNVNLMLGMQLFCVSSNVDDGDGCSFFLRHDVSLIWYSNMSYTAIKYSQGAVDS